MNTKLFLSAAAVAALGLSTICLAQNPNSPAASVAAMASRTPDRTIYLGQLPTPAELTREAAAQRLAIMRIEQTGRSVMVYYQAANGSVTKDDYELMATAAMPMAPSVPTAPEVPMAPSVPSAPMMGAPVAQFVSPAPAAGATTVVVPASPAPAVTYYDYPAQAVYYYSYPADYYYPAYYGYPGWGVYPRFGVNLNFGLRGGFRGGGIVVRNGFRGAVGFRR
jgi:hypothetical protein